MKRAVFVVPGSLDTPTGGYAYDKRIIAELRDIGWHIDVIDLGESFPFPDEGTRQNAGRLLSAIEKGSLVVIDGLAFGVLPEAAGILSQSCRIVALVHHPLALESGLSTEQTRILRESEIAALRHAWTVIVTSALTRGIVAENYGVDVLNITVVRPGLDHVVRYGPRDRMPRDDLQLLSVGSLVERKGYDLLVEALSGLKDMPWRLIIAGDKTRDRRVTEKLINDISHLGLTQRIQVAGAVSKDDLQKLYADADVFVLASRFEGYGMVFGEAIAAGLPVVCTDVGNARDIVPKEAGLIVPPNDVDSLRTALRQVMTSRETRASMALAARASALRLPSWRQSGEDFARVLETVA